MNIPSNTQHKYPDLVCLSHLRWDFVFQRPQHLMSRFARTRRVFYVEEPIYAGTDPSVHHRVCAETGVEIITPYLPVGSESHHNTLQKGMLGNYLLSRDVRKPCIWFYTPMALEFVPDNLSASALIYDCMDELSLFRGAPLKIVQMESRLLEKVDLVFTGGVSLFEAKRLLHSNVYAFPSGVDIDHFAKARRIYEEPPEHRGMPHPRLGYAGVIDERMDLDLIAGIAERRPDWQIVMLGPVVKIDPSTLPQAPNIHWLGKKEYSELPLYFSGWDLGMLPFARNDATRFISPTKTPEYLAAGLPVVSTSIQDVVRTYRDVGLVRIADTPDEFVSTVEQALHGMSLKWRERADRFLESLSWQATWAAMDKLVSNVIESKAVAPKRSALAVAAQSEATIATAV